MCGIAVFLGGGAALAERAVASMGQCQRHRGPDDAGVHVVEASSVDSAASGGASSRWTVALGHRRLSILDLSPLGHQPMVHPITGDALVFNGEIYNFAELRARLEREKGVRFRGHSDTEVLLHLLVEFGESSVRELAGMYAFVFWRKRDGHVLLARDPLGIKPLYVGRCPQGLAIASEVRAIIASGLIAPRVDRRGLAGLLAYGAVQEPFTIFQDIEAFPAGSTRWISPGPDGRPREDATTRFWQPPAPDARWTASNAPAELDARLTTAVREHLVADVPVGVFLSSGIDSTVMAGLAREVSQSVNTFTLGFSDQPDLSESGMAEQTARDMGVRHHDIQLTTDAALAQAQAWMDTLDQPSFDGLNTYIISRAVRQAGIVVAISGLGGDELFGGYPSFRDVPKLMGMMSPMRAIPATARRGIFSLAGLGRSASVRDKLADMGETGPDVLRLYLQRRRAFSNAKIDAMGLEARGLGLDASYQTPEVVRDASQGVEDVVAAISRMESRFYMGNMLLRDTDATSMQHSLEVRVPFLDRRVAELAFAIPGDVRLPSGDCDKHMLRTTFARFLRPELANQSKRGFVLPIRRWMQTSLLDLCESSLASLKGTGLVNADAVDATWQGFRDQPEQRQWSHAFLLCVLGRYLQTTGAAK